MTTRIRTTCNRDCPDSCGIVATVEDGRIAKHEGDPEHGVTRGFLCYRGNHYLERFYSPERILHPLRRTERGWQRLSWDDALDLAAEKLLACREAHGPLSVLLLSYSGIKGMVARLLARRFWARFGGCTSTRGGISVEAAVEAQVKDLGATGTHAPEDLENSAAIVVWGKNVAVTRPHCIPFIDRARKRGAQLWVIDPVRCKTARRADRHLALRPGSDAMLAAGVARLLIERGAVDQGFVERHCAGFDAYRERVLSIPLEDVLATTDLSMEEVSGLADLYATVRPLATLAGLGPSYWRRGGEAVRLIDALGALSGNIGVPGGGVHTDIMETPGLDLSPFRELSRGERRELLLPRLGEEIPGACEPPLRVGFVAGANPAATCPDTGRVREALSSLEFLGAAYSPGAAAETRKENNLDALSSRVLGGEDRIAAHVLLSSSGRAGRQRVEALLFGEGTTEAARANVVEALSQAMVMDPAWAGLLPRLVSQIADEDLALRAVAAWPTGGDPAPLIHASQWHPSPAVSQAAANRLARDWPDDAIRRFLAVRELAQ